MKDIEFPINKKDFKGYPVDFRIEAIVADGMWYDLPKWRKLAKAPEEDILKWIEKKTAEGTLLQSPTGAKSYRYAKAEVIKWHEEHDLEVGEQVLDFIFPARLWDGKTEVEAFLESPLREIGVVTFECTEKPLNEIKELLKGVATVREEEPNKYKAYCLSADYVKPIIQEVFGRYSVADATRIYSRSFSRRRSMVDFSDNFAHHLIAFYKSFAKTLVKGEMETIKIYIPDPQDQESQIVDWVITAIEKFDESTSVPFSGYLHSVLKRWPFDLPYVHLGRDLSHFQRSRAKALTALRNKTGVPDGTFSATELAKEMGMRLSDFTDLEEKHHIWMKTKNASPLTWDENNEEKSGDEVMGHVGDTQTAKSNAEQANNLSRAIISAALGTSLFADAFVILSQMGTDEIDMGILQKASEEFVLELGAQLGVG